jgi:hypothetical protein
MGLGMKPTIGLIRILRKLYVSGINVLVRADANGSLTVSIGKQRNRFDATEHFDSSEIYLVADWLECKARELCPREYGFVH